MLMNNQITESLALAAEEAKCPLDRAFEKHPEARSRGRDKQRML